MAGLRILEVTDAASFALLPPCADPRFDHRTCDYWEDADRGSKAARASWLAPGGGPAASEPVSRAVPDNPFMPPAGPGRSAADLAAALADDAGDDLFGTPAFNPFAPAPPSAAGRSRASAGPRKLGLLVRGLAIFGSYAKVLLDGDEPVAYAQFGPLSAYPRAARIRELYPRLPQAPLPAVISCIATTAEARSRGLARHLVEDVFRDLEARGFAAVEAYPDRTLGPDESSAATPSFWEDCGFSLAVEDERFPVMRRELA